ncbi:MAG: hypothetical protein MJE77_00895 [Proteobacteria bacterium]|nr:hypothetical protein [Pseudomonadota bacterium]
MIGGSCEEKHFNPQIHISNVGTPARLARERAVWTCAWNHRSSSIAGMAAAELLVPEPRLICYVHQDVTAEIPVASDECDCPEVQSLQQRIVAVQRENPLGPKQFARVSAQCEENSVLINGGCALTDKPHPDRPLRPEEQNLSRSGFARDWPDTWHCAWNSPGSDGNRMLATAFCLKPPDYGPDLTHGRIVRVEAQRKLASKSTTTFRAACEPSHLLIGGSCMIDADDSFSHYVTIYHHGLERFDDGQSDPYNTWRCAWNNPTTRMPMATVTAVCVAPPPGEEDRVGRITVTL